MEVEIQDEDEDCEYDKYGKYGKYGGQHSRSHFFTQVELNSMTDTVKEFMFWAETQVGLGVKNAETQECEKLNPIWEGFLKLRPLQGYVGFFK